MVAQTIVVTLDKHLTVEQAKEDAYKVAYGEEELSLDFNKVELVHSHTNKDTGLYGAGGAELAHFVFFTRERVEPMAPVQSIGNILSDLTVDLTDHTGDLAQCIADDIMLLSLNEVDCIQSTIEMMLDEWLAARIDDFASEQN
jgi:hypothetical protein